jgi:hypothetical protein
MTVVGTIEMGWRKVNRRIGYRRGRSYFEYLAFEFDSNNLRERYAC